VINEDQGVDGRIILECILENYVENVCTGLIWLRTGSSDVVPFGFIKSQEISLPAERLWISRLTLFFRVTLVLWWLINKRRRCLRKNGVILESTMTKFLVPVRST
jgi:hypothetical protein